MNTLIKQSRLSSKGIPYSAHFLFDETLEVKVIYIEYDI